MIETNTIPIWEYRLEKNIIPNDGSWQNNAIMDLENYRNQLLYITIVTEDVFSQDSYLTQQYGTYEKYKSAMQAQIDDANEKILIAQNSLDAEKPDMKFVPDGSRSKTVGFLGFSVFVALFAVLIGGWIIAREFSAGTIRLLMIRPKTRTKIIMSKFLAVLVVVLAVYAAGSLLNIVSNGIVNGFADFGFPNFTATGQVGFLAYYLPKFLVCIITILIGYSTAFMLSTVTKNMAVAVIVPAVVFIGSYIGMSALAYRSAVNWIAYTPIPYIQFSSFFTQWSPVNSMIANGVPISLTYGIIMMLAFSALFTFIAVWVFNKSDITK
jgi:ABC-2 type transport system permease protein